MTESRRLQEERTGEHSPLRPGASMRFTIEQVGSYLRGDLYQRKTVEETRQFLQAMAAEAVKTGVDRVLISVHSSRPIFRFEQFGLSELLQNVALRPAHRVATVADNYEGRLAQQYVVVRARQQGLNVRSFRSEDKAIAWLESQ